MKQWIQNKIIKNRGRTYHSPQREILRINNKIAAQLPIEDRMFILNDIGQRKGNTPFDKVYYCAHCKHKFYDNNNKNYRRTVVCPYCYRTSFTEHQEKREYTFNDLLSRMFDK